MIDDFFSTYPKRLFAKGETIISSHHQPTGIYYLSSGYVRMEYLVVDGRSLTVNILKPGSYFSMIWAIADIPNVYEFEAITPVEVSLAPREAFVSFISSHPDILFDLTKRLLSGMNGMIYQMPYLLTGNARDRVIATLLLCSKRFGKPSTKDLTVITLPLTHQDLANIAGITRETTSLIVSKLVKDKLISYQGRSTIVVNHHLLEDEINSPSETDFLPII